MIILKKYEHFYINTYMEQVTNIINYLLGSSDAILAVLTGVIALASAIAAMTKTPKDDTWVGRAYKVVDWLALNIGKAKDKAPALRADPKKKKITKK